MTKPYKGISKKGDSICCWHIKKMCISVGILFHAVNRWIRFSQVKALRSLSSYQRSEHRYVSYSSGPRLRPTRRRYEPSLTKA